MTEKTTQNSLLGKIAAYTEILAKDPSSTIFVSLSEAYRKMGMLDDARKVIEKGLQVHTDFGPAHIVRARILCQQGEYQDSENSFKKALEFDPTSLAALVGFARLYILLGQEESARPLLLDARELSPADPVINKLLLSLPEPPVEQMSEIADDEKSLELVTDEAVEESKPLDIEEEPEKESPDTPPLASSTLADLYLRQGLTEQALDMYRQLLVDNPDNLELRRKIRDVEELSDQPKPSEFPKDEEDDADSIVITDETISQVLPSSDGDVALEEEIDCETETVVTEAKVAEESEDDRVLATLNLWLDSIKKRREDV